MIDARDIITIKLQREDLAIIYRDAKEAAIGGASHVRANDRDLSLMEDQMTGLIGNYALCIWRDGDNRAYLDMRHMQNRFRYEGDQGYDLPRCRFDVKASMMRSGTNPLRYNLPVRPGERHHGWVYGLALVEPFTVSGLKDYPVVTVHLVGWTRDDALPESPQGVGVFKGAFVIPACDLRPFTPLIYERSEIKMVA